MPNSNDSKEFKIKLGQRLNPVQIIFLEQLGAITKEGNQYILTLQHERYIRSKEYQDNGDLDSFDLYIRGVRVCQWNNGEITIYPREICYTNSLSDGRSKELHENINSQKENIKKIQSQKSETQIENERKNNEFFDSLKYCLGQAAFQSMGRSSSLYRLEPWIKPLLKLRDENQRLFDDYVTLTEKRPGYSIEDGISQEALKSAMSRNHRGSEDSLEAEVGVTYHGADYHFTLKKAIPEAIKIKQIVPNNLGQDLDSVKLPEETIEKLKQHFDEKIVRLKQVVGFFYNRKLTKEKIVALEQLKTAIEGENQSPDGILKKIEEWETKNASLINQNRSRISNPLGDTTTETREMIDDLKRTLK